MTASVATTTASVVTTNSIGCGIISNNINNMNTTNINNLRHQQHTNNGGSFNTNTKSLQQQLAPVALNVCHRKLASSPSSATSSSLTTAGASLTSVVVAAFSRDDNGDDIDVNDDYHEDSNSNEKDNHCNAAAILDVAKAASNFLNNIGNSCSSMEGSIAAIAGGRCNPHPNDFLVFHHHQQEQQQNFKYSNQSQCYGDINNDDVDYFDNNYDYELHNHNNNNNNSNNNSHYHHNLRHHHMATTAAATSIISAPVVGAQCCLSPPSPAPINDRYVGNLIDDNHHQQHHHHQHYHHHQQKQQQYYHHHQQHAVFSSLSSANSTASLSTGHTPVPNCSISPPNNSDSNKYMSGSSGSSQAVRFINRYQRESPTLTDISCSSSTPTSIPTPPPPSLSLPLAPIETSSGVCGITSHASRLLISSSSTHQQHHHHHHHQFFTTAGGSTASTASISCGSNLTGSTSSSTASSAMAMVASYLSVSVHTPVKRYVPTPPPSNELYGNDIITASATTTSLTTIAKNVALAIPVYHRSTRVKCCANEQQQTITTATAATATTLALPSTVNIIQQQHHHYHHYDNRVTDYYATSPRFRSQNNSNDGIESPVLHTIDQQQQLLGTTRITSPAGVGAVRAPPPTRTNNGRDYLQRAPNAEYINSAVVPNTNNINNNIIQSANTRPVNTPTNTTDDNSTNNNSIGSAATCLHCSSTVRRTTGVHQTTQTTGPISPIPATTAVHQQQLQQQQFNVRGGDGGSGGYCYQLTHEQLTSLKPAATPNEINISSPLSPTTTTTDATYSNCGQQQKKNQYLSTQKQSHKKHLCNLYNNNSNNCKSNNCTSNVCSNNNYNSSITCVRSSSQHVVTAALSGTTTALPIQQQSSRQQQQHQQQQSSQQQQKQKLSNRKRVNRCIRKTISRFFGVELSSETEECGIWKGRQRRLALRRFGALKLQDTEIMYPSNKLGTTTMNVINDDNGNGYYKQQQHEVNYSSTSSSATSMLHQHQYYRHAHHSQHQHFERPDILQTHDALGTMLNDGNNGDNSDDNISQRREESLDQPSKYVFRSVPGDFHLGDCIERRPSVITMIFACLTYIMHTLHRRPIRYQRQWSRSFAPANICDNALIGNIDGDGVAGGGNGGINDDSNTTLASSVLLSDNEVFFDTPSVTLVEQTQVQSGNNMNSPSAITSPVVSTNALIPLVNGNGHRLIKPRIVATPLHQQRSIYMTTTTTAPVERLASSGWRTSSICGVGGIIGEGSNSTSSTDVLMARQQLQQQQQQTFTNTNIRGTRISAQLLDSVLENSRRPPVHPRNHHWHHHQHHHHHHHHHHYWHHHRRHIKLYTIDDLDDRYDHRPYFTYWINTVQILVLILSLICYGIGPIGIGMEKRTGQVLVTSLSLQTVQHTEPRNLWIGPSNNDLVHMGAKFTSCMRRDVKIMDVLQKTRRQERETACCIRNDDSGCVQSSQADCSIRGLFPTKSISTWKKWSPGESGPGGRISGSVCGLDPKYCDAPASIAPYEWPDDITKWPICRKTNSFPQRFRYKDHTAEHMVCEVIGHPCCTGIFGECRITTREYCDFVNGYFHEEASLCSQISCLSNVCGMFPFISLEAPDQFYRLFTSLCLHAGILHLAITVIFQHVLLADLERLIGPIRTAIVYIGSGLAGNLTSAILVPYKPEVGPLASLCGIVASLAILLLLIHWKHLRKPHVALFKLVLIGAVLFALGTLPWQMNFTGLLAGIFCGIFLTVALVPFVSIKKYARKAKIKLIWSCLIFHIIIYIIVLVIFYLIPMELTNLNFGEVLTNGFNTHLAASGTQSHHHDHSQQQLHNHHGTSLASSSLSATTTNTTAAQLHHHHRYQQQLIDNDDVNSLVDIIAANLAPNRRDGSGAVNVLEAIIASNTAAMEGDKDADSVDNYGNYYYNITRSSSGSSNRSIDHHNINISRNHYRFLTTMKPPTSTLVLKPARSAAAATNSIATTASIVAISIATTTITATTTSNENDVVQPHDYAATLRNSTKI